MLLQACDRKLALSQALICGIDDRRQSGKVRHDIGELGRQRLYAIACGYPDANDAVCLGMNPIRKFPRGRDPVGAAIWPRSRRCRALGTPTTHCSLGEVSQSKFTTSSVLGQVLLKPGRRRPLCGLNTELPEVFRCVGKAVLCRKFPWPLAPLVASAPGISG